MIMNYAVGSVKNNRDPSQNSIWIELSGRIHTPSQGATSYYKEKTVLLIIFI
jgi:hypothetical protein